MSTLVSCMCIAAQGKYSNHRASKDVDIFEPDADNAVFNQYSEYDDDVTYVCKYCKIGCNSGYLLC